MNWRELLLPFRLGIMKSSDVDDEDISCFHGVAASIEQVLQLLLSPALNIDNEDDDNDEDAVDPSSMITSSFTFDAFKGIFNLFSNGEQTQ